MPINSETIRHRGLVSDAAEQSFRTVGYDHTIGSIFVPRHGILSKLRNKVAKHRNKVVEEYEVPPQGVVVVFSQETVELPGDICAYAMPKTSLCSEGILVFNTGIVDPGYRGLLSGTTVNFSDSSYKLKKGDPFLRLVFEPVTKLPLVGEAGQIKPLTDSERKQYISDKVLNAIDFPGTFLNIPRTVKAVSSEVLEKERNLVLYFIGIATIVLTLLTVLPMFIPKDYLPNSPTKDDIDKLAKEYAAREDFQDTIQQLSNKIDGLEVQLQNSRTEIDQLRKGLPASVTPKP